MAIYYVDTARPDDTGDGLSEGAAWKTIAKVNASTFSAGDSILLKAGCTWAEKLTIPSGGNAGNQITLSSYGTGAKPILAPSATNPAITVTAASRGYWTIDGLDLRSTSSPAIYFNYWPDEMGAVPGWIVQNCNFTSFMHVSGPNIQILNNTFNGSGNSTLELGAICLRGDQATGATISGNTISNFVDRGIWLYLGATNCNIYGNTISNITAGSSNSGAGINLDGYDTPVVGCTVYGNTIHDVSYYGITLENATDSEVYGNLLYDNGVAVPPSGGISVTSYAGYRSTASNISIHNNLIRGVNQGINIYDTKNVSILNNTIWGDEGADSSGLKVMATTTYTSDLTVTNNIIGGAFDYPLNVPDNASIWTQLDYNDIVPVTTTVMIQIVGGNKTLANLQAVGLMTHGLISDPLLVSTSDFHLQAGSPCWNAGVDVGLTTDYAGNPIYGTPDIGAYERGYETYYLRASGTGASPQTVAGAYDADDFNTAGNWTASDSPGDGKIGPGDTVIVLDDDGPIRATLTVQQSGLSGKPITIQGEATTATIKGSEVITGWTLDGGNIWQATVVWTPYLVLFDEVRGTPVAAKVNVDSSGDWFWAANVLYVYSTSDPDSAWVTPGIEAAGRDYCVLVAGVDYVTISNLTLKHANSMGLRIQDGSYVTASGLNVSQTRFTGIMLLDIGAGNATTNFTAQNCVVSQAGGAGIQVTGDINRSDHVTITGNTVTSCGWNEDGTDNWNKWTAGIKVWGGYNIDPSGKCDNALIERNIVSGQHNTFADGSGTGIWVDQWGDGAVVRYNLIHDNDTYGLLIENMDNAEVYYNIVYTNLNHGIVIYRSSSGNKIYNNVSYNHIWWGGLTCIGVGAENYMLNNIFKNNISYGNDYNIHAADGGENAGNGSGNVYLNNSIGVEGGHIVLWGAAEKTTVAAFDTAYGSATGSVAGNPLFVSASDFHLQAGSPCINAGVDVGLDQDYAGNPIYGAPDIGAYEYQFRLIPNVGEARMIRLIVNATTDTAAENLRLRLYKNDVSPASSHTLADYTEATFTGYTPVTLSSAGWTVSAGTTTSATYSSGVPFTCSGTTSESIYGYYLTGAASSSLFWVERFHTAPCVITYPGDALAPRPAITLRMS